MAVKLVTGCRRRREDAVQALRPTSNTSTSNSNNKDSSSTDDQCHDGSSDSDNDEDEIPELIVSGRLAQTQQESDAYEEALGLST